MNLFGVDAHRFLLITPGSSCASEYGYFDSSNTAASYLVAPYEIAKQSYPRH